ncbi:hypothetical protein QTI24_21505 [Variovorax sp. J22P240]|uniref:hypothetical protein n=1 Tax=Variovorax sp. J22P240 TaxID=3053514 RepID=UPI002574BC38|nr:hypothetical protein [Variovorax sp. J22P240]MDM0001198.1 hypothetical protein [Variovorax sp. J22P240]
MTTLGGEVASKRQPEEMATLEGLVGAIDQLTAEERRRLYRQGNVLSLGSEFASGNELLNETVKRALIGASGDRQAGERGRPWPRSVNIVAFLMECMKSIANGSHKSVRQKIDRRAEALATDEGEANPEMHAVERHHPSVEDELAGRQEKEALQTAMQADVAAIRKLFAQGDVVHDILDGEEIGMSPEEIRDMANLTPTQYASARKKLRRTVDKHYPGRRQR